MCLMVSPTLGGGTVKQSSTNSVERLIKMQHAAPPTQPPLQRGLRLLSKSNHAWMATP